MKYSYLLLFGAALTLAACGSDSDNDTGSGGGDGGGDTSNTAPEAVNDEVTAETATELSIDVLENDTDADGDALEIIDVSEPENGTATIDGDVILYTSNDDYTGSDSFTYTISDGEDEASADVSITVQQTVSISGKVVDSPIANATVTVTLGGETYTAEADEDGVYSLDVTFSEGAELLTIMAQGSAENNQDHVELVSALQSMATLAQAAGDDGVLERSEAPGTNVTNVTTASYTLMREANGGEAPADEEALSVAQEAVDPNELLEVSAVIKLIVDNENFSLPEDTESVLDLVQNKESYNAYVEDVKATDPEALDAVVDEIVNDPELVEQEENPTPPSFYMATSPTQPGFVSRSYEVLVFESDGSGMVVSPVYSDQSNSAFTWEIDEDGYYVLTYENPVQFTSYLSVHNVTDDPDIRAAYEAADRAQVQATYTENGKRFKVITKGNRQDSIREEYTQTVTYEPLEWEGETYQIPPGENTYTPSTVYLNGDSLELIPVTQEDVVGTWAVNVLGEFASEDGSLQFASDMVAFNEDGTFSALYTGVEGTWELSDGTVEMFYGDVEQTVEVFNQIGGLYGALMAAETSDGNIVASYNRVVKQDPEIAAVADDILTDANELWFGHINSWPKETWDQESGRPLLDYYFGWQFEQGTTGYNVSTWCNEVDDEGWCINDPAILTATYTDTNWYLSDNGQTLDIERAARCVSWELSEDCMVRRWHLLHETEDGWVYVLEYEFEDFELGNGTVDVSRTWVQPRVNMMELRNLPGDLSNPDMGQASASKAASARAAGDIERIGFLPRFNNNPAPKH
ncbi:Ig-like domain-containing protein [Idiomarina piscisalsi]|uniref:Cadherin-like domain-containing protein n=1 Tax=Idiomarina piscisalsi TaxID=1096243 RepID=A0A432YRJ7_9GAMM|nr:Ig-like domain-containing protein [Idiomarina piscisalsi]RUO64295.1 hypothetical protein CWI73_09060 [Idiomarina piscisalsi]